MPDKATTRPLDFNSKLSSVLLTLNNVPAPAYVSEPITRSSIPDHTSMSSVSNSALTAKNNACSSAPRRFTIELSKPCLVALVVAQGVKMSTTKVIEIKQDEKTTKLGTHVS
jgi:hypothetical protein